MSINKEKLIEWLEDTSKKQDDIALMIMIDSVIAAVSSGAFDEAA